MKRPIKFDTLDNLEKYKTYCCVQIPPVISFAMNDRLNRFYWIMQFQTKNGVVRSQFITWALTLDEAWKEFMKGWDIKNNAFKECKYDENNTALNTPRVEGIEKVAFLTNVPKEYQEYIVCYLDIHDWEKIKRICSNSGCPHKASIEKLPIREEDGLCYWCSFDKLWSGGYKKVTDG